eukprot:CAMPEP_0119360276 /NCGR_PEP_ID=MMETSP1334-20130426/7936_1 /TAXON_ID=127549 /ORGANISM="Calcidiscus leptoporus, Strain RCC1130" /LENGTH=211 /DNA_ID=CAMNT_0007375095 /DNA_START=48 /DNA_END=683 /DNA_ORIENTATION=-
MSRDDAEGRKIFIGGLPFSADEHAIREDFGKYGPIEDVYLPKERDSGKLRGFGFVTFKDSRDAREASDEMHGRDYRGREITCNIARPRDAPGGGGGGGGGYDRGGGGGGRGYDRDERGSRGGYDRGGYDRDRRDDYSRDRRDDYDRDRRDDYDRRDDDRRGGYDRRGDDDDRRGGGGYRDERGGRDDRYGPGYSGYSYGGGGGGDRDRDRY